MRERELVLNQFRHGQPELLVGLPGVTELEVIERMERAERYLAATARRRASEAEARRRELRWSLWCWRLAAAACFLLWSLEGAPS